MPVNPMMEGVRAAGVNGMHAAFKGLNQAAQEIADLNVVNREATEADRGSSEDSEDMADAAVRLKLYQRQVQASARVVETADAVVGFLLDVHA
ncbi:MAG: hypothetical protein R3E86_19320 [Pseudomonadales bacterium]